MPQTSLIEDDISPCYHFASVCVFRPVNPALFDEIRVLGHLIENYISLLCFRRKEESFYLFPSHSVAVLDTGSCVHSRRSGAGKVNMKTEKLRTFLLFGFGNYIYSNIYFYFTDELKKITRYLQ